MEEITGEIGAGQSILTKHRVMILVYENRKVETELPKSKDYGNFRIYTI